MVIVPGDQVSKNCDMTGGFYDSERSKLKLMKIITDNKTAIKKKTAHLEHVGKKLVDILLWFSNYCPLFLFTCGWFKNVMPCYYLQQLKMQNIGYLF